MSTLAIIYGGFSNPKEISKLAIIGANMRTNALVDHR